METILGSKWVRWIAGAVIALALFTAVHFLSKKAERFEAAAQRATAISVLLGQQANTLSREVDSLRAVGARRDTVIRVLRRTVATTDSAHPVTGENRPNVAVRDSLIVEQAGQISDLNRALTAAMKATALLREANDSLGRALAMRPTRYNRFVGPTLALGASVGIDPVAAFRGQFAGRLVVGVTLNVLGVRL